MLNEVSGAGSQWQRMTRGNEKNDSLDAVAPNELSAKGTIELSAKEKTEQRGKVV